MRWGKWAQDWPDWNVAAGRCCSQCSPGRFRLSWLPGAGPGVTRAGGQRPEGERLIKRAVVVWALGGWFAHKPCRRVLHHL